MKPLRILLLEDSPLDAELIMISLSEGGLDCSTTWVQTRHDFVQALDHAEVDLILADYSLPEFDGYAALELARDRCPAVPFVFVSGALGEELAIETMKRGATDFILKHRLERLVPSVRRALAEASERAERKKAEESLRLLAEVSAVLTASLDERATLDALARFIAPRVADWCIVDLVDNDGLLRRLSIAHADPGKLELAWLLEHRFPVRIDDPNGSAAILRAGRSRLIRDIDARVLHHLARSEEHLAGLRGLGLCSAILAPLFARGKTFGVLTLLSAESGRQFGRADLALAESLAQRAAQAVDNARLYREAQRARQEAEAANRAKDQFLAVLSHELRTPLTPVLAAVSEFLEDCNTDSNVRLLAEMVHRNVELEARLIDDLLDVNRITQGKLPLNREIIDAYTPLHRAVEICWTELERSRLRLELDLSATETYVDADPARLQQVYWNLIKNAIKFTPEQGLISIRASNEAPGRSDRPRLIVAVTDTGIGIEPASLEKIFDAFEQGGIGITRRFGGLGLGLAISRSLIELHGGWLTAASAGRGMGATFTVKLETVHPPVPSLTDIAPSAQDRRPAQSLRILYVEDNPDTSQVMARLLRKCGHTVTTADRLTAALDAARHAEFDLVISDLGLPDGSGLDLMRRLSASRGTPGIALSGFGTDEDLRRCAEAGFLGHLTKPIDFPKLKEMIRTVRSPGTPTSCQRSLPRTAQSFKTSARNVPPPSDMLEMG